MFQAARKMCLSTRQCPSKLIAGLRNTLVSGAPGKRFCSSATGYKYETLDITIPKEYVFHVKLNRPDKLNALNTVMWREIGRCMDRLSEEPDCRVIVLSGEGRLFCSGIDLTDLAEIGSAALSEGDAARKAVKLLPQVKPLQDYFTAIEKCQKPVIAAIHGPCVGAGVDLITATDIRYCTKDAWFQVKEVEVGLAADVGTLQRLPKVIGSESLVRELALSARKMFADEALHCGLVSRVFDDKKWMIEGALHLSETIAQKSPVAVQGTKVNLVYSRDHTVQEGLDFIRCWNMCMLQSEDLMKAAMAQADRKGPPATFSKL